MRVVTDPTLLLDLLDFLSRTVCVGVQISRDALQVTIPGASDDEQARRELLLYLAVWRAMPPGAHVALVSPEGRRDESALDRMEP